MNYREIFLTYGRLGERLGPEIAPAGIFGFQHVQTKQIDGREVENAENYVGIDADNIILSGRLYAEEGGEYFEREGERIPCVSHSNVEDLLDELERKGFVIPGDLGKKIKDIMPKLKP